MYFNPSSIKRLDYIFKGLFKSKKKLYESWWCGQWIPYCHNLH